MTKRKLKPFVIPLMYTLAVIMFVFSMYFIQKFVGTSGLMDTNNEQTDYVDDEIIKREDQMPVVNTEVVIAKPYLNDKVTVGKDFYDYKSDSESQEKALVYYENTYMQNSGVDFVNDEVFDVVSILDGTVTKVYDDEILGKVVEVKNSKEIISIYQALSEVSVKKDDKILQGQVIGKSGTSNINKDLGNHLHFELYYQGMVVNPMEYFNKSLGDL